MKTQCVNKNDSCSLLSGQGASSTSRFQPFGLGMSDAAGEATNVYKPQDHIPATLPPSGPPVKTPVPGVAEASYVQQANSGQFPKVVEASHVPQAKPPPSSRSMSGWEIYKEDQLLRNPGGDDHDHETGKIHSDSEKKENFAARTGKDLSAVGGNLKNFFENLFLGSKLYYRDQNNEIKEGRQRGLFKSVGDFFKNLASAFTFGSYHPGREKAPEGFKDRIGYTVSKIQEAIFGDLVGGVTGSINHMGKNLLLAGWNLIEVLPDATIGNFDAGKKLTTSVFDNGQVLVEYLTDVVPSGDAWFRVHATNYRGLKPPIVYNLTLPEYFPQDVRWQYVRNTPFRKAIETIGALLADAAAILAIGQTGTSSANSNQDAAALPK